MQMQVAVEHRIHSYSAQQLSHEEPLEAGWAADSSLMKLSLVHCAKQTCKLDTEVIREPSVRLSKEATVASQLLSMEPALGKMLLASDVAVRGVALVADGESTGVLVKSDELQLHGSAVDAPLVSEALPSSGATHASLQTGDRARIGGAIDDAGGHAAAC